MGNTAVNPSRPELVLSPQSELQIEPRASAVLNLQEMGFDGQQVRQALVATKNNKQAAVEKLLNGPEEDVPAVSAHNTVKDIKPADTTAAGLSKRQRFKVQFHKVIHHKQVKTLQNEGYADYEAVAALKANSYDLETSLQYLRSLHRRRNFIERTEYDQWMLARFKVVRPFSRNMLHAICMLKRKAAEAKERVKGRADLDAARPEPQSLEQKVPNAYSLLQQRLQNLNLSETMIEGDGNCQFRAISHELFGDQQYYNEVRTQITQFIRQNKSDYLPYFASAQDHSKYVDKMSKDKTWGDEITLRACADVYKITVHVVTSTPGMGGWYLIYSPSSQPDGVGRHVFLSYHYPVHYNVMIPDSYREDSILDSAYEVQASPVLIDDKLSYEAPINLSVRSDSVVSSRTKSVQLDRVASVVGVPKEDFEKNFRHRSQEGLTLLLAAYDA